MKSDRNVYRESSAAPDEIKQTGSESLKSTRTFEESSIYSTAVRLDRDNVSEKVRTLMFS